MRGASVGGGDEADSGVARVEEIPVQIPKPSDDDKAWFHSVVPDDPRVEVKPMFGNLGAFVHGNMFMGLFGPDVGVRLPEKDAAELRGHEGAGDFGPEGRPMKAYVRVPAGWRDDPERAREWAQRALDHVADLTPKAK